MQETNESVKPPGLSELEGAILSELQHRGRQTAFKVRRSFATSPSIEWRGSAGAVYAAIRRLEGGGFIEAEEQGDRRGTRILWVTQQGREALATWSSDIERAISVGVDPFRLRCGLWDTVPPDLRSKLFENLQAALISDIEALKGHRRYGDIIETDSIDLAIRLQQTRLDWLRAKRTAG